MNYSADCFELLSGDNRLIFDYYSGFSFYEKIENAFINNFLQKESLKAAVLDFTLITDSPLMIDIPLIIDIPYNHDEGKAPYFNEGAKNFFNSYSDEYFSKCSNCCSYADFNCFNDNFDYHSDYGFDSPSFSQFQRYQKDESCKDLKSEKYRNERINNTSHSRKEKDVQTVWENTERDFGQTACLVSPLSFSLFGERSYGIIDMGMGGFCLERTFEGERTNDLVRFWDSSSDFSGGKYIFAQFGKYGNAFEEKSATDRLAERYALYDGKTEYDSSIKYGGRIEYENGVKGACDGLRLDCAANAPVSATIVQAVDDAFFQNAGLLLQGKNELFFDKENNIVFNIENGIPLGGKSDFVFNTEKRITFNGESNFAFNREKGITFNTKNLFDVSGENDVFLESENQAAQRTETVFLRERYNPAVYGVLQGDIKFDFGEEKGHFTEIGFFAGNMELARVQGEKIVFLEEKVHFENAKLLSEKKQDFEGQVKAFVGAALVSERSECFEGVKQAFGGQANFYSGAAFAFNSSELLKGINQAFKSSDMFSFGEGQLLKKTVLDPVRIEGVYESLCDKIFNQERNAWEFANIAGFSEKKGEIFSGENLRSGYGDKLLISQKENLFENNLYLCREELGELHISPDDVREVLRAEASEYFRDPVKAEIKVDMSGMKNIINKETSIDSIVTDLTAAISEAVTAAAEGVHNL